MPAPPPAVHVGGRFARNSNRLIARRFELPKPKPKPKSKPKSKPGRRTSERKRRAYMKEYAKRYRAAHRKELRERNKAYFKARPGYWRRWYAAHREARIIYKRKWRKKQKMKSKK